MNYKNIEKVSEASYISKFSCLGTNCEFTCCGGWDIAVDRDSFDLVQEAINKKATSPAQILSQNPDFTRAEFYGKLHLRNCSCPLLDSDFLCSLQKAHGEKALPLSCSTFPRVNNYINGSLQKSARLSCPEIARLVLMSAEISLIEKNFAPKDPKAPQLDPRLEIAIEFDNRKNKSLHHYFFEIQNFIFEIIKNRNIKIEERLGFLILLMSNLTKVIIPVNPTHLDAVFASIRNLMKENKNEKSLFKDIDFQHEFLVGNIITEHIKVVKNLNYPEKYLKFINSLAHCESLSSQNFETALYALYEKFSKEHFQILENFLLNWVLNEMFPFKSESIHYETLRLIINFSLIRFIIIANSINKTAIESSETINSIFMYSRIFGNTELPKLKSSFRSNKDDVFELLYILINI